MLEAKFVAMTWLLPQRAMGTGLERDIVESVFRKRGLDVILLFLERLDVECLIN
jgi:hypothetical protein